MEMLANLAAAAARLAIFPTAPESIPYQLVTALSGRLQAAEPTDDWAARSIAGSIPTMTALASHSSRAFPAS
jgi:hypothetical protein